MALEAKMSVNDAASTDVFVKGMYVPDHFTVEASKNDSVKPYLPAQLYIVTPTIKGMYPVLLFCHGWMMHNDWYSTILYHIASHGYIVVAPQFYSFIDISMCDEIDKAVGVIEWLSTGLLGALEKKKYNIYPDVENNLVVAGHSRGGKVAFALALGETCPNNKKVPPHTFKAVIGVDPVAGRSKSSRPDPKILHYKPRCFNMSIPVAVVGTGLGNQPKTIATIPVLNIPISVPPCAPDGVNHAEFFKESKPPVCYFVAKEFGHFDMMDDNFWLNGLRFFTANGEANKRGLMRRAVAGTVVAFLRTYLGGREEDLDLIVKDPDVRPITLDPVHYVKE